MILGLGFNIYFIYIISWSLLLVVVVISTSSLISASGANKIQGEVVIQIQKCDFANNNHRLQQQATAYWSFGSRTGLTVLKDVFDQYMAESSPVTSKRFFVFISRRSSVLMHHAHVYTTKLCHGTTKTKKLFIYGYLAR